MVVVVAAVGCGIEVEVSEGEFLVYSKATEPVGILFRWSGPWFKNTKESSVQQNKERDSRVALSNIIYQKPYMMKLAITEDELKP